MKTKHIALTAVILALAVAGQLLKNLSPYITGPIVNLAIIISTLAAGLLSGVIISVVTPITSFLITGSPLMAAVPLIIPCVIIGNLILAASVYFLYARSKKKLIKSNVTRLGVALSIGTVVKAAVMAFLIAGLVLPTFGAELPEKMIAAARTTFSITQLITSSIASAITMIIWPSLKKTSEAA